MSSSVGYYYSAAEVEAQRVRQLRAQIAELRVRHDRARARGATVKVSVPKVRTGQVGDSTVLAESVAVLQAATERAEEQVEAAWRAHWRERMRDVIAEPAVAATRTRTASPARVAEPAVDRAAEHRRQVLQDATNWLDNAAPQCDPEDVNELTEELARLSAIERVADLRAANLSFAQRITESKRRRREREQAEEARASLLELAQEASEAERAALAESVRMAADPESWRTAVYQAVERADVARARDQVAAAAARALTEAGCAVGEDFATVLASQQEAVVAFDGKPPGYGLLVRLPADGARIMTAVVRSDASEQRDVEAQQGFCDSMLPKLVASLRAGGVRLDEKPFVQLQPGERAVPVLADKRLQPASKVRRQRQEDRRQTQAVLRERSRPT